MADYDEFSPEVCEKIGFYVYELIDPRNGHVFYIGKGSGNRVFAHVKEAEKLIGSREDDDDEMSLKIRTINEIKASGLNVISVILRHGMSEKTAFDVEAALIDATPGLLNVQGGHGSEDNGPMNTKQIIDLYAAEEINEFEDKCLLIKIRQSVIDERNGSIYETVRSAWRLNPKHASKADYILAVKDGLIIGAFVNTSGWLPFPESNSRYYFEGSEAPKEICEKYVGKRLGSSFRKKAAASPVRYSF